MYEILDTVTLLFCVAYISYLLLSVSHKKVGRNEFGLDKGFQH